MKKFDGFLFTILILVLGLTGLYLSARSSLNYFDENPALKAKYERKQNLNNLAKRLKKIEAEKQMSAARMPAALPAPQSFEITDAKILSKKYFLDAKAKCYELNQEVNCLRTIEEAVTHYPESEWTGQSLVLLADFYYRTKRLGQARDILKILKQDFKTSKVIQEKVLILERHLI